MLLCRLGNPVDLGISSDSLVEWVYQDDFVVLVGGVLVDPVRVQNPQSAQLPSCPLLSYGAEVPLELQLVDTLVARLTVYDTLAVGSLAAATTDSHTVYNKALK